MQRSGKRKTMEARGGGEGGSGKGCGGEGGGSQGSSGKGGRVRVAVGHSLALGV